MALGACHVWLYSWRDWFLFNFQQLLVVMAAVWGSTAELNSHRVCKPAWLTETRDFIQRDYCHPTLRGLYQTEFPNRAFLDGFSRFLLLPLGWNDTHV